MNCISTDPPTYVESVGGAVNLNDDEDDDDEPGSNMGDLTYTPMYTYVYNYRPPPLPHSTHNSEMGLPLSTHGKYFVYNLSLSVFLLLLSSLSCLCSSLFSIFISLKRISCLWTKPERALGSLLTPVYQSLI